MDIMKLGRFVRTTVYLEDRNFGAHPKLPEAKTAQDETAHSRLAHGRGQNTGL